MHRSHILSFSILAIFHLKNPKKHQKTEVQVNWKDHKGHIEILFEKNQKNWSEKKIKATFPLLLPNTSMNSKTNLFSSLWKKKKKSVVGLRFHLSSFVLEGIFIAEL